MSRKTVVLPVCCLVLAACAGNSRSATTPSPVAGTDVVWFTGASNIRHFSCSTTDVAVFTEAAPELIDRSRSDNLPAVRSAAFAIPVRSLDCGIHQMNNDLQETLAAESNPTISFRLSNYVMIGGKSGAVRMNGLLTIAGHEKMTLIYGKVIRDGNGGLRLLGNRVIDVRDFGVTPPRKFFGLLKVQKEITIHFNVAVRPLIDPLGILATFVAVQGDSRD